MNKRTNCPNCGAPIVDIGCAYCGTTFLDFSNIEICGDKFILRLLYNGQKIEVKAICTSADISFNTCDCCYIDDAPFEVARFLPSNREITLNFIEVS